MTPFITVELDNVMCWVTTYIGTTIIPKFYYFADRANMITAHPHEAFRNFDFVTYFKFHIVYNMRLCLGPFWIERLVGRAECLVIFR